MIETLPLLILSNVIVDDIRFADGTQQANALGGAGVYAAIAASHWWKGVALVAGIGDDFSSIVGTSLSMHHISNDGFVVRDANTIRSRLLYFEDGERSEIPEYGLEHFRRLQLTPADIKPSLLPAAGTYVFRDLWPTFWDAYRTRLHALGQVLWEIQSDVAEPQHAGGVTAVLPFVDIFSINLAEAIRLLTRSEPKRLIAGLHDAGANVVILRMGADGALVSDSVNLLHVLPPPSLVLDVTGGGNSFSAGFLAGWCRCPGDLEYAARCAAASAAIAIGQVGPPLLPAGHLLSILFKSTAIKRLHPSIVKEA